MSSISGSCCERESQQLEADLALSALHMALGARVTAPGLVQHSDRGTQYACDDYRAVLAEHGIVASMSQKGSCWDNAVAESFIVTLEFGLIVKSNRRTRDEARRAIFRSSRPGTIASVAI